MPNLPTTETRVRHVCLDDQLVIVRATGEYACSVVDFVTHHLDTWTPDGPTDEVTELNLVPDPSTLLSLRRNGEVIGSFGSRALAVDALMQELTQRLIWDYKNGLALHGALIEVNGVGILLPAVSGSGKSTLATYAATQGHILHTDELVFAPFDQAGGGQPTKALLPLRRPVHLKPGSTFLLERATYYPDPEHPPDHWMNPHINHDHVWHFEHGALLDHRAFSNRATQRTVKLGGIVLPRYEKGAALDVTPLTAAGATFAVLSALVNARNLPHAGVPQVAALCAGLPAMSVVYEGLAGALEALSQ